MGACLSSPEADKEDRPSTKEQHHHEEREQHKQKEREAAGVGNGGADNRGASPSSGSSSFAGGGLVNSSGDHDDGGPSRREAQAPAAAAAAAAASARRAEAPGGVPPNGDEKGLGSGTDVAASTEDVLAMVTGMEGLRRFTYSELQKATRKFATKLGEGGFGSVFKGRIDPLDPQTGRVLGDGQQVSIAVKLLDACSQQGEHEWKTEIEHLAALKHKHVVRLLGYCQEEAHRVIVYEFVPYGSFDYHVFAKGRPPVSFADRLKVALHAAKGLHFLHQSNVIYRDFKTSNILVDKEFNAKLADFGLAREGPGDQGTHVSTGVKGTICYMAPEYILTGHLTQKCDVFSFGVVLLEIISGQPASTFKEPGATNQSKLVDFANRVGNKKSTQLQVLDTRLKDEKGNPVEVPLRPFKIALQAALMCSDPQPMNRPEMTSLVNSLEVAYNLCCKTAEEMAEQQ